MKRDMDLIRKILQYLEEVETFRPVDNIEIEGYSEEQIRYALIMMCDANLIDASERTYVGRSYPVVNSIQLTATGHDFLDATRDSTVWSKRKEKIIKFGSDAFFEIVKTLGVAAALALLR